MLSTSMPSASANRRSNPPADTNATLEKGKPNSVFDADGSAVVVHAQLDDYKTDPTGNAGGRIACGVIE